MTQDSLVFVVDDDPNLRAVIERWLRLEGYDVNALADGAACLEALAEEMPDAICLDVNMPGVDGFTTLERIRERHPMVPVLMITADGAVDSVVRAMRSGAYSYFSKPVDRTRLLTELRNALEHHRLTMRVSQLEREVEGRGYPGIVGKSEPMQRVFRQLDRLAVSDVTVLIHGESGTGKELVARAIHESSGRARGPFVAVNAAAIPESLIESELFGHEKGAFTGALNRRIGRFEEANGGTLFLDEVGELPAAVQVKLLRVLQERTFQRVGGQSKLASDFRLISATHRNLADEVRAERFREDLYFRIAVFELEVPALRKRRDDIPLLVNTFIKKQLATEPSAVQGVAPDAMRILMSYSWPGNVRELQNTIQRSMVVAEGEHIRVADLPGRILPGREAAPVADVPPPSVVDDEDDDDGATLEDASRRLLVSALVKHGGNASAAMRELRVGRTRFYRMVKKFGLEEKVEELRQGKP